MTKPVLANLSLWNALTGSSGVILNFGEPISTSVKEVAEGYRDSADGNPAQQLFLGDLNSGGAVIKPDPKAAKVWYEHAATNPKNPNPEAAYKLGLVYKNGEGVKRSVTDAEYWFNRARTLGYTGSIARDFAELYDRGRSKSGLNRKALDYYEEAAWLGDLKAHYRLGKHYMGKDDQLAVEYIHKAATGGDVDAQLYLAESYDQGLNGYRKNTSRAVDWFKAAAESGNATAQYALALHYLRGIGVARNKNEALKWFNAASNKGHKDAKKALSNMLRTTRVGSAANKVLQFLYEPDPNSDSGVKFRDWGKAIGNYLKKKAGGLLGLWS